MASKTSICNKALRRLGVSQTILNVDTDNTTQSSIFKSSYDDYIEIMKDKAINMSADYIPDRPGF